MQAESRDAESSLGVEIQDLLPKKLRTEIDAEFLEWAQMMSQMEANANVSNDEYEKRLKSNEKCWRTLNEILFGFWDGKTDGGKERLRERLSLPITSANSRRLNSNSVTANNTLDDALRGVDEQFESNAPASLIHKLKMWVTTHARQLLWGGVGATVATIGVGSYVAYESIPEVRRAVNQRLPAPGPKEIVEELAKMGYQIDPLEIVDQPVGSLLVIPIQPTIASADDIQNVETLCDAIQVSKIYLLMQNQVDSAEYGDVVHTLNKLRTAAQKLPEAVDLASSWDSKAQNSPLFSNEQSMMENALQKTREEVDYIKHSIQDASRHAQEMGFSRPFVSMAKHRKIEALRDAGVMLDDIRRHDKSPLNAGMSRNHIVIVWNVPNVEHGEADMKSLLDTNSRKGLNLVKVHLEGTSSAKLQLSTNTALRGIESDRLELAPSADDVDAPAEQDD